MPQDQRHLWKAELPLLTKSADVKLLHHERATLGVVHPSQVANLKSQESAIPVPYGNCHPNTSSILVSLTLRIWRSYAGF